MTSNNGFLRGLARMFEGLRDRVVHGSQVGKRKLDATFTRRELDAKLLELGARYSALAAEGLAAVPVELAKLHAEVRSLEERLAREEAEIAQLRHEGALLPK